jgi:antitoxin YefM
METITATAARSNLFNLIKKAAKEHRQYRVVSKSGEVILLSQDDFESLLETLELLSTPGLLKSIRKAKQEIRKGETYSLNEVFGE